MLDLTQTARAYDEAVAWLSRAAERGLATPEQVRSALGTRRKVRWRAAITDALRDISAHPASAAASAEPPPASRGTATRAPPHGLPR